MTDGDAERRTSPSGIGDTTETAEGLTEAKTTKGSEE